jgi:hypothetical protein
LATISKPDFSEIQYRNTMRVAFALLSILSLAEAFVAPQTGFIATSRVAVPNQPTTALFAADENNNENNDFSLDIPSVATATAAFWTLTSTVAGAAGPDWGIFEGRTGSLLHPITMFGMLGLSISTALLGFNWRRQRTIGDEIKEVKKQLPDLQGAKTVQEALTAARAAETVDTAYVNKLEAALPLSRELQDLESERKELSQKNSREKHFNQGALLAAIGTIFAIEVNIMLYGSLLLCLFIILHGYEP